MGENMLWKTWIAIFCFENKEYIKMCGRFSFASSEDKLRQQFGDIDIDGPLEWRYNVAPTQPAYLITDATPHRLQRYYWGLLPFWSKEKKITGKLINARSETIAEKPSFRTSFRRRRCWVPADSFYEWRREGKQKIPYRILPANGELLVMAGIWEIWGEGEEEIRTFSILTTEPNREIAPLHNRMPVLLTGAEAREAYLLEEDLNVVRDLLHPPPDDYLRLYRVSQQVNSPRNDTPALHQAVEENRLFD